MNIRKRLKSSNPKKPGPGKRFFFPWLLGLILLWIPGSETLAQLNPSLLFEQPVIDFGTVNHQDTLFAEFPFLVVADSSVVFSASSGYRNGVFPGWLRDTLKPGERDTLRFVFTDGRDGKFLKTIQVLTFHKGVTEVLEIRGERAAGPPNMQQTGQGTGAFKVFPKKVDLSAINTFETRRIWFRASNWGPEPLQVASTWDAHEAITLETAPFWLEPGESQWFSLLVNPAKIAPKERSGYFQIQLRFVTEPFYSETITLSGIRSSMQDRHTLLEGPRMLFEPNEIDMGTTFIGDTTKVTMQVKNTGESLLRIDTISFLGQEAIFHSLEVPPKGEQPLTFTLPPAFRAWKKTTFLRFESNDPWYPDRNFVVTEEVVEQPFARKPEPKPVPNGATTSSPGQARIYPAHIPLGETLDSLKGTPRIAWLETDADFGKVIQGRCIARYRFRNAGNAPLLISSAKASCGCMTSRWPREPVLPGDTAEVMVEINLKGKAGMQMKSTTVRCNDPQNPHTILRMRLEIIKDDFADMWLYRKYEKEYGDLALVTEVGSVGSIEPWETREALYHYHNRGDEPLRITQVSPLPPGITLVLEDSLIPSGKIDSFLVRVRAPQLVAEGFFSLPIIFEVQTASGSTEKIYLSIAGNLMPEGGPAERPVLDFENNYHREDTLIRGPVSLVFPFRNSGTVPLEIKRILSEESTQDISFPLHPVLPGETGEIRFTVQPDHLGPWGQTISVYSNADSRPHLLYVAGWVVDPLFPLLRYRR